VHVDEPGVRENVASTVRLRWCRDSRHGRRIVRLNGNVAQESRGRRVDSRVRFDYEVSPGLVVGSVMTRAAVL